MLFHSRHLTDSRHMAILVCASDVDPCRGMVRCTDTKCLLLMDCLPFTGGIFLIFAFLQYVQLREEHIYVLMLIVRLFGQLDLLCAFALRCM